MLRTVTFLCLCLVTTIALAFEKSGLSIVTAKGSQKFEVELAITPAQQSQGLMYRRDMPANAGMLFVYNRPQPLSFWMKNTFIPLDMLFIDGSLRIAHIVQRTIPLSTETINSSEPAISVLELNAGTVSKLGIKPGDVVMSSAFEK